MSDKQQAFVWYELMTSDPDGAKAFYDEVVGWTIGDAPAPLPNGETPDMDYRMLGRSDGGSAGGMLALSEQMLQGGARPAWIGYLQTEDVDAKAAQITAEGGAVHMPPMTMEGVGRMAMVTDPQGAPFYLMKPMPPAGMESMENTVFDVEKPQHVRWNELMTTDPDAAVAFYRKHFGIEQDGEMSMGEMGAYRFIHSNGVAIGAIMPKMEQVPHSVWSYYIGVDDIDRAASAVTSGGGQVINGPMEIPGGEFALNGIDPQGAMFGLVGPRKG